MKLHWSALAVVALLVAPALGQPRGQRGARGPAELGRAPRGDRPATGMQARIERIRAALDLDEEQQAEFDRIAAEFREKRTEGPGGERMRELAQEMREARRAGDTERVAEIREELRAARGGRHVQEFLDEIEGILRDDQREKLAEIRQRIAAERRPIGGGGPIAQLRRLRAELKLSEEQAKRYDELFAEFQDELGRRGPGGPEAEALVQELIKAVEAGDEARIEELKEQLSTRVRGQDAVDRFLAEVEQILEPDQVEVLQRFRERMHGGRGRDDLERMFRLVRRLDLDDEQRQALREIERDARRAAREKRRDPAALAELSTKVQEELRGMLSDQQVTEFDRLLEQQRSDRPHRGRHADRPRGPRRGQGAGQGRP
jgi:hypothetical protein